MYLQAAFVHICGQNDARARQRVVAGAQLGALGVGGQACVFVHVHTAAIDGQDPGDSEQHDGAACQSTHPNLPRQKTRSITMQTYRHIDIISISVTNGFTAWGEHVDIIGMIGIKHKS